MTESPYDGISRARAQHPQPHGHPHRLDVGAPDLSHLTPEERAIIEGVMQKQQQEESREIKFLRAKQHEVGASGHIGTKLCNVAQTRKIAANSNFVLPTLHFR